MFTLDNYAHFVPQYVPHKMVGTITTKIRIKKDYVKADGTAALYLEVYQQTQGRKRLNLNIYVKPKDFDVKKQRVKNNAKHAKDFNLVIEKILADINAIEVSYRLSDTELTIEALLENLTNPGLRVNFLEFYHTYLNYQRDQHLIKESTYNQQLATYNKIKEFKPVWLFSDITEKTYLEFRAWLKIKKKNKPATVEIACKNFKKYLHAANKKGIKTKLTFEDISIKRVKGNITYLLPEEVRNLHTFLNSPFINDTWHDILTMYLFSCFTGLRLSDVLSLKEENFLEGDLVFVAQKTGKLQRVKLNDTAKSLVTFPQIFRGTYAEQTINKELKNIAKARNIKKRLYFHSARHTFATNYLIAGGQLQNLQSALGHSDIKTTMVYVHAVKELTNTEIKALDSIISN